MAVINFQNLPSTNTPLNDTNLNAMQVISEVGSNANGSYIKYEDGTLICYVTKSINFSFSSSQMWGSMWESDSTSLGTFPYTFYSTPTISVTNNSGAGGFIEGIQSTSTTSIGTTYMCRPLDTNTAQTYTLSIIAIGRWKA